MKSSLWRIRTGFTFNFLCVYFYSVIGERGVEGREEGPVCHRLSAWGPFQVIFQP